MCILRIRKPHWKQFEQILSSSGELILRKRNASLTKRYSNGSCREKRKEHNMLNMKMAERLGSAKEQNILKTML